MFITFELIVSMRTYASVIWGAWLPVYSSHHWVFFCLDMSTSRQQLMVCNAKIHRLFSLLYIFHIFCYLTEVYKSDMNPWPNSRRATRDKTLSPKILRTKRKTEGELGRVDLTVFSPISSQPCFCLVLSVSLLSSPLANPSSLSARKRLAKAKNQPDFPTPISEPKQRPINRFPGPLYQNEVKCSAFDMEIIFHSHENKNHFHKKLRLCTWPHFESGDFSRDKLLHAFTWFSIWVAKIRDARSNK